jgi:hypothetical protein
MRRVTLSVLPWALFLGVIAVWLPGLIFDATSLEVTTTFDKVWALSFLAFPVVGLFLTRRLPGNPVGWLFLIGPGLVGAGVSLGEYGESTGRDFGRLSDVALEIGLMAMFASILLFPNGRYPNRLFKWAHLIGIVVFAAMVPMDSDLGVAVAFNFLLPVAGLIVRFARGGPLVRRQIAGPVAVVFLGLLLIGASAVVGTVSSDERWGTFLGTFASIVLTVGVPVTIGIAILKFRLYEIDRIISRTVGYVIVIVLLGAVYFAGIAASTAILPSDSPLAVAASTLAAAALFNPVRKRVQTWVDRRFNRSRYDAEHVMDQFVGTLRDEVDQDTIVDGWLRIVTKTMAPTGVGLWVRS